MTDELFAIPQSALDYAKAHPPRKGHAGHPGSGPDGETCGSCQHYALSHHRGGTYRKCGLVRANWSHGPGTDIRKRDPACELWKAKEPT